jgi:hypothetical protein
VFGMIVNWHEHDWPEAVDFFNIFISVVCIPWLQCSVTVEGEELGTEVQAMGFPIEHKHKLCCLRQELIDSFVE